MKNFFELLLKNKKIVMGIIFISCLGVGYYALIDTECPNCGKTSLQNKKNFFQKITTVFEEDGFNPELPKEFYEKIEELCKLDSCIPPNEEQNPKFRYSDWEKELLESYRKERFRTEKKLTKEEEKQTLERWYKDYSDLIHSNDKEANLATLIQSVEEDLRSAQQSLLLKRDYEIADLHESILIRLANLEDFEKINQDKRLIPNEIISGEKNALYRYRKLIIYENMNRQAQKEDE